MLSPGQALWTGRNRFLGGLSSASVRADTSAPDPTEKSCRALGEGQGSGLESLRRGLARYPSPGRSPHAQEASALVRPALPPCCTQEKQVAQRPGRSRHGGVRRAGVFSSGSFCCGPRSTEYHYSSPNGRAAESRAWAAAAWPCSSTPASSADQRGHSFGGRRASISISGGCCV